MAQEDKKEKKEKNQQESPLGGKENSVSERVDNTKKKIKKIKKIINFLKRHPLIAKALFYIILAIIIIILFIMILYTIDIFNFSGVKDEETVILNAHAQFTQNLDDENLGEENTNAEKTTYKTTGGILQEEKENETGTGKYFYYLLYGNNYNDEDKKAEAIDNVKSILSKRNIEIYNNQCLLFLAAMNDSGLDLNSYNKEQLEAMYMFYKAEIATSSFDLRSKAERDSDVNPLTDEIVPKDGTYKKEDYDENDFSDDRIQGNIRVQKVTYNESGETTTNLEYIPQEEFQEMLNANNKNASNYFTVDEENNLIVAGWNHRKTTYSFDYGECYNQNISQEVESQYQNKDETSAYKYKSIPYLNYISKYTMPFSFLMSFLSTQTDVDFCRELAKIAETSHITITLQEEYSYLKTTTTLAHDDHELIYAKAKAKMDAEKIEENTENGTIIGNEIASSQNDIRNRIRSHNPNNEQITTTTSNEGQNITYTTYTWRVSSTNTTYTMRTKKERVYNNMAPETSMSSVAGNFVYEYSILSFTYVRNIQANSGERCNPVTKDVFIQKEGTGLRETTGRWYGVEWNDLPTEDYETLENCSDYTKKMNNNYKVTQIVEQENNSYKFEVTEVDNWYEIYKKTYSDIETEDMGQPDSMVTTYLNIETNTRNIPESEIENKDYIVELRNNGSVIENFTKDQLRYAGNDISKLENFKMEFSLLKEKYYIYGKEDVTTGSTGTKYKKGSKETQTVQVKVQNENTSAIVSINADAFAVQNNSLNQNAEGDENKEEIFETTREYENGFLPLLNQHESVRSALRSIDSWVYKMLDSADSSKNISNLVKYLLFLYNGTDLGVAEYKLTLLEPDDFTNAKVRGSAIVEWLRSYEFNTLREYRNGNESLYDKLISSGSFSGLDYVKKDDSGKLLYGLTELDYISRTNGSRDHSLNFSYGLLICPYESRAVSQVYINLFNEEGIDIVALVNEWFTSNPHEAWCDADIVDRIQVKLINESKASIKDTYAGYGIELEEYELDALLAIQYGHGNCFLSTNQIELLKNYKAGTVSKEEVISQFHTKDGFYPFTYSDWVVSGRANNLIMMFFEGRYILSTGEEIDPNGFTMGGITTQEEADSLTEYFSNEILCVDGTFEDDQSHGLIHGFDSSNVPECFRNGISPFQCPWWAYGRASLYLQQYGDGTYPHYPTTQGNGGEYYQKNIEGGWFDYGPDPRPNSIGSYGIVNEAAEIYGHVFYVEGVTDEGIWVSDCGSGVSWRGVHFWDNSTLAAKHVHGYIYLDSPL